MIYFSLVLMSRSRPSLFRSLCRSIENTAFLNYEIIVGLDNDDINLNDYLDIAAHTKNCILDIQDRNSNLHIRMNSMLNKVNGKYIFVLNDDCLLTNYSWDKQACDILDSFGDIVYGRTRDNSIDRVSDTYAAFPIVSTKAAKQLGFIMDNTYGNHGSDVVTYRIYDEANKVVDLHCVTIDHIYHNSVDALRMRQNDRTATEMINRTINDGFNVNNLFTISVTDKAMRIK